MVRHVSLDCVDKRFTCPLCEKNFKRKYHLNRHFSKHIKTEQSLQMKENFIGNSDTTITVTTTAAVPDSKSENDIIYEPLSSSSSTVTTAAVASFSYFKPDFGIMENYSV